MPYDDIRFSWWDDPEGDDDAESDDAIEFSVDYDYDDDVFFHEYECRTCGKEVNWLDNAGDCSWCHMVNNS